MVYIFARRPKADQTILNRKTVHDVSRLGTKKILVADALLKEHPELKPIFRQKHKRDALASKIFEKGGGAAGSKTKDRFGFTEKDLLETVKDLRSDGLLTRKESIKMAKSTLKSTGRRGREYLREIYSFDPGKTKALPDVPQEHTPVIIAAPSPVTKAERQKTQCPVASMTDGTDPTIPKRNFLMTENRNVPREGSVQTWNAAAGSKSIVTEPHRFLGAVRRPERGLPPKVDRETTRFDAELSSTSAPQTDTAIRPSAESSDIDE